MDVQAIKDRILQDLRNQYPDDAFHEVKAFKKNSYGFYNVFVDMEKTVLDGDNLPRLLSHHRTTVPYPRPSFEKLTLEEKKNWTDENVFVVKPLGAPSGILYYLDFIYKGSDSDI